MIRTVALASGAALLAMGAAMLSFSGAAGEAAPRSADLMVRIAELEIDPAQLDAYKVISLRTWDNVVADHIDILNRISAGPARALADRT